MGFSLFLYTANDNHPTQTFDFSRPSLRRDLDGLKKKKKFLGYFLFALFFSSPANGRQSLLRSCEVPADPSEQAAFECWPRQQEALAARLGGHCVLPQRPHRKKQTHQPEQTALFIFHILASALPPPSLKAPPVPGPFAPDATPTLPWDVLLWNAAHGEESRCRRSICRTCLAGRLQTERCDR